MPALAILVVCTPCTERFPSFDVNRALEECREYAAGYRLDVIAEMALQTCVHCGAVEITSLGEAADAARPPAVLVLGGHPHDDEVVVGAMEPFRAISRELHLVGLGAVPWEVLAIALRYYRRLHNLPDSVGRHVGGHHVVEVRDTSDLGDGSDALRLASAASRRDEVALARALTALGAAGASAMAPEHAVLGLFAKRALFGQAGRNLTTGGGRGQDGVPLGQRTDPLPHDGLFIRRNNAFGTKSAVGVPELIEQSILPDQTQIRFDDFVAGDPSGVPAPPGGEAIRVSHGRNAVEGRYKAHDETTHFVEIALRAAPQAPAGSGASRPLAVNFIFVVDVSGSMDGEKLATVKAAIRELYAKLRPDDVLGIITFDTKVRTALRATRISDLDVAEVTRTVNALRADGGTDLNLGLLYGIDEIGRFGGDRGMLNCIYLFSDGDPTSGERDWITIRKNVAARLRGGITLSCFGFGSDARTRELDALAGLSGGHSTFVTQPEEVTLTLADDVQRRDHLAAVNIQLRIDFPSDLVVWHLYGHNLVTDPSTRAAIEAEAKSLGERARRDLGVQPLADLITGEKGIRIFAPDLAYGETYWIVFEVQTAGGDFGTARIQYVDTGARANRHVVVDLGGDGDIDAQTVLAHGIGLWTSEVTFFALDDLYDNDKATASARLHQHADLLRDLNARSPMPQLQADWVVLDKMSSLASTLGQSRSFADGSMRYATFVMDAFGRARDGYFRI